MVGGLDQDTGPAGADQAEAAPRWTWTGVPGMVLAGDLEPPPQTGPWAALLPALDSTPMGWQRREWFLGQHAARLFDRTGNVGPTLWWDGRIVGGWAQDRDDLC